MGRVVVTHYEESVVDQLYPGNVQLNPALRPLVTAVAGQVNGFVELSRGNKVERIVLDKAAPLARTWVEAFRALLAPQHVAIRLNEI